jgi:hypothetical protein
MDNSASWLTATMIALSLIPAFYASLSDTLLQIVPKLHQNIGALQRNQVEVSIGRLVLLFSALFVFPLTYVAIIANGIPRIYGNIKLYKIAGAHSTLKQKPDAKVRADILKIVSRILPGSIYYAISGQLTIWLVSFFGEAINIAQIGALSRLTMLISIIILLIDFLFVPRFAKLKNHRKILLKEYFSIQGVLVFISSVIVLLTYLFDDFILFVLGDNYKNLNKELLLMAVSACVGLFSMSTNKLLSSRGIIIPPVYFIPFMIFVQISMIFLINLSTVQGIILYSILTTLPIFLIRILYLFKYLSKK